MPGLTTQELNAARDHFRGEVLPSAELTLMDAATEELRRSKLTEQALRPGNLAPDFILPDALNRPVRLQALLARGPVVVAFYRGGWCPYCNIELRDLQRALPQLENLGTSLLAISPQLPDRSLTTAEKNALTFPVLSDIGTQVARQFGIVFTLPEALLAAYREFGHGLEAMNGPEGALELPVPATFVVAPEGVIRHAYVEVNYTQRLGPDDLLAAVEAITSQEVRSWAPSLS